MIFIPFSTLHLEGFTPRKEQLGELSHAMAVLQYANGSYAWTGFHDGEVVAMGGVLPVADGNGALWALFAENLGSNKVRVIKECKFHFKNMLEHGYERLQTVVRSDFSEAIRFAEWLGFKREGFHPRYAGGVDYFTYAMIKE